MPVDFIIIRMYHCECIVIVGKPKDVLVCKEEQMNMGEVEYSMEELRALLYAKKGLLGEDLFKQRGRRIKMFDTPLVPEVEDVEWAPPILSSNHNCN